MLKLHPHSLLALKKGHPWVTKDSFTAKFPRGELILKTEAGILLHDPQHPHVKAHLWPNEHGQATDHLTISTLKEQIVLRLKAAIQKRLKINQRENRYLVFGQADLLPGLMLLQLGGHFIFQAYAFFWPRWKTELVSTLQACIRENQLWEGEYNIYGELRQTPPHPRQLLWGKLSRQDIISEYGIYYHIDLTRPDFGIYTDMAAIRPQLLPFIFSSAKVLNLYAYTGAFTLYALQQRAQVTSVDLSQEYLNQLEANIKLNPQLNFSDHTPICSSVQKALPMLLKNKQKFDLIIVDPPSASSSGQQKSSAWQAYPQLLPLLTHLLSPHGKLVLFLNTHKISFGKFQEHLRQAIKQQKLSLTQYPLKLTLREDCPTLPNFSEGNYLKGTVWEKGKEKMETKKQEKEF